MIITHVTQIKMTIALVQDVARVIMITKALQKLYTKLAVSESSISLAGTNLEPEYLAHLFIMFMATKSLPRIFEFLPRALVMIFQSWKIGKKMKDHNLVLRQKLKVLSQRFVDLPFFFCPPKPFLSVAIRYRLKLDGGRCLFFFFNNL